MADDLIVQCDHLVKFFDTASGRVQAVRGIDMEVGLGVTTAIVGPSGSGKSSLLRMIAGLDRPTAGLVLVDGVDVWSLGARRRARLRADVLTSVAQRSSDNLFAHLTAAQQLSRLSHNRPNGSDDVEGWLARLGLLHRSEHRPDAMSGGERQRLAFARAAVAGHRLVIADEPTSQLDATSTGQVMDAIDILAERGVTVLLATHDRRVLERVDEVITLRDGAIASVTAAGSSLAVVDRTGRLQLPPELRDRFPERRVRLVWDEESDRIELERP